MLWAAPICLLIIPPGMLLPVQHVDEESFSSPGMNSHLARFSTPSVRHDTFAELTYVKRQEMTRMWHGVAWNGVQLKWIIQTHSEQIIIFSLTVIFMSILRVPLIPLPISHFFFWSYLKMPFANRQINRIQITNMKLRLIDTFLLKY